jgi:hypothetical protein
MTRAKWSSTLDLIDYHLSDLIADVTERERPTVAWVAACAGLASVKCLVVMLVELKYPGNDPSPLAEVPS